MTRPGRDRPALPAAFGLVLDRGTRRIDGGATLVGGSPLTVLRLQPAGARLLDDLFAGACVSSDPSANGLARRLLDLGLAHPRPPPNGPRSPVTVVIPVRDDPVGLAVTLTHLGPGEPVVVVVVDDGSADPAAVRAAARLNTAPTRVLRLEPARGPGGARQVGWEAATTEVVAFVDAGCAPAPGWLGTLTAHLADPAVAAAAPRIRATPAPGAPTWLGAYEEARSPLDLGPSAAAVRPRSRVPYVPTATLVVRRAALESVGGFDAGLRFGEDVDLVWRLDRAGWVVRYEPGAEVGHPARPNLPALLRQRFDYGCSAAPLAERHGRAVAPLTVSAWSAAAWGLALLGEPAAGGVLGVATAALVAPRLRALPHPVGEAFRLAGAGHLRAGQLLAEACRRAWWPALAAACVVSRRARRAAVMAAVVPPLLERPPPALGLPTWLGLRLADDLAYGAGVWAGAARGRSAAALRPSLTSWPGRR